MATFQDALDVVRALSPADRIRLLDVIWDEVPPSEWPPLGDAWLAEIQRRSIEYDEGRMSEASWVEVDARARRKAGLDD